MLILVGHCLMASPSFSQDSASTPDTGQAIVSRIVFGSCIKQDRPIPILKPMLSRQPDLVLFLGDNIYADTLDMGVMRAKYDLLGRNRDLAELRSRFPVMATWDDHDYGANDAGADYPMRTESKREFMRFWQVAADAEMRKRDGVHHARIFGPMGKRVQIIMLDTRSFRSPLKVGAQRRVAGPYVADDDPTKTVLGSSQWVWLEKQLRQPAELRILATSIQCIPEAAGQETWSNLPRERRRLFDLIGRCGADGVILVSGDRHWSEISKLDVDVAYPLYEITSSSLNQIHPRGTPSENRHRVGKTTYHRENYGVLSINWEDQDPNILMQIEDVSGNVQMKHDVRLSTLAAP